MGKYMFKLAITAKKKTKTMIKKLYSLDSFVVFESMSKVNKTKGWSTTKLSIRQEWQNVYMYVVQFFKYCAAFNLSLTYFKFRRA